MILQCSYKAVEMVFLAASHYLSRACLPQHCFLKNPNNIVFQTQGDGQGRFVWIDSFGCKQAVPLRKWSKWVNTRGLNRVRDEIVAKAEKALARRKKAN